jgi:bacterioferritin
MDKDKITALLNVDLQDEHGAIIQYLNHAYAMGEGEIACEIEATARDEMRHLDWLAETIVDLGGVPSLERGKMLMTGKSVADWMKNDVQLERGAIDQYREHIKLIDDPKINRLLQRIVADEEAHQISFGHFIDKTDKEGAKDVRGSRQDKTTETLDWGIEHEYTVILQYLIHSYMTPNLEAKKSLEDRAINEMQHLGWLAEEMVSSSGNPTIEHTEVYQSNNTSDMLRADINIEKEVANVYDQAAKEAEGSDLKRLYRRIRDNEKYHIEVFNDLLEAEEEK